MRFLQTLIARSTTCAPITGVVETTSPSIVETPPPHVLILQDQDMLHTCRRPSLVSPVCPSSAARAVPVPRSMGRVFVWVVSIVVVAVSAVDSVKWVVNSVAPTADVQRPCFGVLDGPDGEECQRRGHGDRQFPHLVVLVHRVLLLFGTLRIPSRIGRMRHPRTPMRDTRGYTTISERRIRVTSETQDGPNKCKGSNGSGRWNLMWDPEGALWGLRSRFMCAGAGAIAAAVALGRS